MNEMIHLCEKCFSVCNVSELQSNNDNCPKCGFEQTKVKASKPYIENLPEVIFDSNTTNIIAPRVIPANKSLISNVLKDDATTLDFIPAPVEEVAEFIAGSDQMHVAPIEKPTQPAAVEPKEVVNKITIPHPSLTPRLEAVEIPLPRKENVIMQGLSHSLPSRISTPKLNDMTQEKLEGSAPVANTLEALGLTEQEISPLEDVHAVEAHEAPPITEQEISPLEDVHAVEAHEAPPITEQEISPLEDVHAVEAHEAPPLTEQEISPLEDVHAVEAHEAPPITEQEISPLKDVHAVEAHEAPPITEQEIASVTANINKADNSGQGVSPLKATESTSAHKALKNDIPLEDTKKETSKKAVTTTEQPMIATQVANTETSAPDENIEDYVSFDNFVGMF